MWEQLECSWRLRWLNGEVFRATRGSSQSTSFDQMCLPSSYHNGAGNFNFADGHAEIHKWRDARTNPTYRKDVHLTILPGGNPTPSPNNPRRIDGVAGYSAE